MLALNFLRYQKWKKNVALNFLYHLLRPFKSHTIWMERCTTCQSKRAWWISQKCETSLKLFSYSLAPTAEGRILNHGMLPFKILKEPKLIMFQVKIIHNILPTQSRLFHSRITDTDVFPLCNLESQSLKHMLITCSVSSSFWTCFSNWWHEKFNQKLTLSESTILYGWHKESNNWEVLKYCLIVAKYSFCYKRTQQRPGLWQFSTVSQ